MDLVTKAKVAELIRNFWPTEHPDHCASVWCEGSEDDCTCGMAESNAARAEALRLCHLDSDDCTV